MTQDFLLSDAAQTLRLEAVMRMSEKEARQAFARIRWQERNGKPACSRCDCEELYTCTAEKLWKCKGCGYRFSLTSGTIFASRKLPFRDILVALAIFANGDKKHSAMQLSRDLDVQYKTAFMLSHKIRDTLNAQNKGLTVISAKQQRRRAVAASRQPGTTEPVAVASGTLSEGDMTNSKIKEIDRRLAQIANAMSNLEGEREGLQFTRRLLTRKQPANDEG
jgi:transposase-like protein